MDREAHEREKEDGQRALAVGVAGLLSQIGCVTIVLIGVALVGGLWLDARLDTRPLFTILFILASVPVTLYLMVRVVLSGMTKLQSAASIGAGELENEEAESG